MIVHGVFCKWICGWHSVFLLIISYMKHNYIINWWLWNQGGFCTMIIYACGLIYAVVNSQSAWFHGVLCCDSSRWQQYIVCKGLMDSCHSIVWMFIWLVWNADRWLCGWFNWLTLWIGDLLKIPILLSEHWPR